MSIILISYQCIRYQFNKWALQKENNFTWLNYKCMTYSFNSLENGFCLRILIPQDTNPKNLSLKNVSILWIKLWAKLSSSVKTKLFLNGFSVQIVNCSGIDTSQARNAYIFSISYNISKEWNEIKNYSSYKWWFR